LTKTIENHQFLLKNVMDRKFRVPEKFVTIKNRIIVFLGARKPIKKYRKWRKNS